MGQHLGEPGLQHGHNYSNVQFKRRNATRSHKARCVGSSVPHRKNVSFWKFCGGGLPCRNVDLPLWAANHFRPSWHWQQSHGLHLLWQWWLLGDPWWGDSACDGLRLGLVTRILVVAKFNRNERIWICVHQSALKYPLQPRSLVRLIASKHYSMERNFVPQPRTIPNLHQWVWFVHKCRSCRECHRQIHGRVLVKTSPWKVSWTTGESTNLSDDAHHGPKRGSRGVNEHLRGHRWSVKVCAIWAQLARKPYFNLYWCQTVRNKKVVAHYVRLLATKDNNWPLCCRQLERVNWLVGWFAALDFRKINCGYEFTHDKLRESCQMETPFGPKSNPISSLLRFVQRSETLERSTLFVWLDRLSP